MVSLPPPPSAGLLDLTVALNLSQYLLKEKEYVPWDAALAWLYKLAGRLAFSGVYGNFEVSYVCGKVVLY